MPLHDQVICGDSREVLKGLPDDCCDAVVTDPPAAIAMMNMEWDRNRGGRDQWIAWLAGIMAEARRCIRPGGYAFVWALPRTSHWTAMALEDSEWTIRDSCHHIFATGFPKSRSCLKPAHEVWWLAKAPGPLQPLQIDAARIPTAEDQGRPRGTFPHSDDAWGNGHLTHTDGHSGGRWPPNTILSHHPDCRPGERSAPLGDPDGYETVDAWTCVDGCPIKALDEQAGPRTSGVKKPHHRRHAAKGWSGPYADDQRGPAVGSLTGGDTGACSRFFTVFPPETPDPEDAACAPFFYAPKAPRSERRLPDGTPTGHPTQKPLLLCQWLVTLCCPPGGTCLDPFAGVASVGVGALRAGRSYIGIEQDERYAAAGRARLAAERERQSGPLFATAEKDA